MISVAARGGALSSHTKAVSQAVGGRFISPPISSLLNDDEERAHHLPQMVPHYAQHNPIHVQVKPQSIPLNNHTLAKTLIKKPLRVSSGIGCKQTYQHVLANHSIL